MKTTGEHTVDFLRENNNMQYKLYTDAGNFRSFKVLIAAEYNSVNVQVHDFDLGKIIS